MDFNSKYTGEEVEAILDSVEGKQERIEDLDTIRRNAEKGATALQSVPSEYVTEEELEGKGYITEHQDISGKQDVISDLETIRSNAALGATALQSVPSEYVTKKDIENKLDENDIVNNLEDGGADKALSAEMGKYLKQLINGVVSGDSAEAVKFKGYVNVDSKNGIDNMFEQLNEGEACLVAPSIDTGSGDSYKAWIASAINQTEISISEELFETTHNISVANIALGKLEVKTYLKLDEAQPHCKCPDMILLCKVKVKAKDFIEFVGDISQTIVSIIPDSMMLTACIGKVLRWSAGDWLLNNPDKYSLTHKYEPYNTRPADSWETGIIAYTLVDGPISGERFTIIVNASSDTDANGNVTAQQIAYGRTGVAEGRVWTRVGFSKVGWNPWLEISSDKNILPNVNGWLLNSSEQLVTGVYQTCNTKYTHYTTAVDAEGKEEVVAEWRSIGELTNNYCTLFVNASTSPNGDGYDAIEQTVYGREADAGKIYRRVIFYHKANNIRQYGEWVDISFNSSGGSSDVQKSPAHGELDIATETFELYGDIENLTPVGFVAVSSSNDDSINEVALSVIGEDIIIIKTTDYSYLFIKNEDGGLVLEDKTSNYSERFATKDEVATAIANAITNTLNTEV